MLLEHQVNEHVIWVETNQLTMDEKNKLVHHYGLSLEVLEYVTDVYEQSNYDYDSITGHHLLVVNLPVQMDAKVRLTTRPVSFLFKDNYLFTFNMSDSIEINQELQKMLKDVSAETSLNIFLMSGIYNVFEYFMVKLRELMKERHKLDDMKPRSMTNKNLLDLSYLQQTLTYFTNSSKSNFDALNKMLASNYGVSLSAVEKERLEDVIVEANQIMHMVHLESEVVDKIAQIFDSIMNNNLNDTMSILTFWSLALAVPTLVTGFYGMNIALPSIDKRYDWIYLLVVSVVLILLLVWTIKKNKRL
ncbi:magnesium transporter CorA family protein [Vagococcus sp.]|uniref:magnesium transporter CorA family protein n=1 Tax=Vagococcus sp. TaxID=1933889 RepID=UPI003F98340F